jgi:flagellar basal-body rod modification protein FlgD
MAVDPASSAAASSMATTSSKTLAGNFDTFLKLLTAQLQNQDPLEPMDASEFTQQLVQYSSVEQNIYTNKNLETLIALHKAGGLGNSVGYIGREVTATDDRAALAGGEADWTYTLPRAAESVSLVVTNEAGQTVFSGTGPTTAGENTVAWDGKTNGGANAPDGVYRLKVKALDSTGAELTAPLTLRGRVTGVEAIDGSVVLDVGGVRLKLNDVTAVREVAAATE